MSEKYDDTKARAQAAQDYLYRMKNTTFANPHQYTKGENDLYHCPCCEKPTLEEAALYDICDNCGWEDDPFQADDPDEEFGPNHMSLTEARANYENHGYAQEEGSPCFSLLLSRLH